MTAADKILQKALVASNIPSSEWSGIQAGLRDRAFFSAKVEELRVLHEARRLSAEVARGTLSASEFRRDMRKVLTQVGIGPREGDITDLHSTKRLDLIRDQNVRSARGYVSWLEATTDGALIAFPCQELVRVRESKVKRNWTSRWREKGGKLFSGRMIATKSDPIWSEISAFKTPFPPFDYNSGMGLKDISRREALELGVMTEDDAPQHRTETGFNDELSIEVSDKKIHGRLKKTFGDQINFENGRARWRGSLIRENFARGGSFAMRLGEASSELLSMLKADSSTKAFAMSVNQPLIVTQNWLNKKRKKGGDHRVHFAYMPDYPNDKPLTIGDIELIPSIWRKPDRVYDAGRGDVCLELDTLEGDHFRLLVKCDKGTPRVMTFYRSINFYKKSSTHVGAL